jgi:hypothetical protein
VTRDDYPDRVFTMIRRSKARGLIKLEGMSLNLMLNTSLGQLVRDDGTRIIDDLARSRADESVVRDISERLKSRERKAATGLGPTQCYGKALTGCYSPQQASQFAQAWTTFLINIGCSKRHDVQFVCQGISSHMQAIASLDYSVAQSFAARLLAPDCKGTAGLSERDRKRLDRMLPTW